MLYRNMADGSACYALFIVFNFCYNEEKLSTPALPEVI